MHGKKELSGRGILVKLILVMMLLSIISVAIILGVALNEQKQIMESNLIKGNEKLAEVAARSIEAGYIAHSWPFRTLNQINASEDVLFWWIVNHEGEIYLADNPEISEKRISSASFEAGKNVVEDYVYGGEDIKFLIQPLEIGEPGKVEALCIGISLKSVREATNKMIVTSVGYFFMIVAFACALSLFLARRFTKPITQLVEGTKAISRGEFDHRVAIKTGDEIEGLGDSFNKMAQRVKSAIEEEKVARRETENIMNTMINTLIVVDPEGKIIEANKAAFDLLGYSEAELIGMPFDKIIVPINKEGDEIELEKLIKEAEAPITNFETTYIAKDGREIPVNFSASVMKDEEGKLQGIVCDGGDITERKKMEEEREALIKDLEETNRKLDWSNKELQDFVYIASHDLREPMRKISAFGPLLQESLKGKLDEDEQENLEFMIDGATRMQRMIDALLTYSRVTTKAKPAKRVDLNETIEDLKRVELAVLLEETGGTIRIQKPLPAVRADSSQVHQLLQNLIANGLKFNREGILPEIIVRGRLEKDNRVRVEVEDNGIGIEEANSDKVFGMFQRLHSQNNYKGTGIGLAVCKKIVKRHGGSIGLNSTPGKGSTFWFTLPGGEKGDERVEKGGKK